MISIPYYLQVAMLCGVLLWFFSRTLQLDRLVVVIVAAWAIGVSLIFFRYGPIGQWSFYQNDQYWHWKIVAQLIPQGINYFSVDQLNLLRVPYTLPAYLISTVGFDETLSLKFVSLVYLLANFCVIQKYTQRYKLNSQLRWIWLLTSPFLIFFSLLALRETSMLFFVSYIFFGRNPSLRGVSCIALGILRPHLAVAIIFGVTWGWLMSRASRSWYFTTVAATALFPIWLGTLGFSIGNFLLNKLPLQLYQDFFLKSQITQVFSSFVGLQFLTVAYQTVEYTTSSILFIRLLFFEIVLVPLLFTSTLLMYRKELTQLKLSVFATFVFFVAVSTGTDYLSVRQTLPLFSILAVVVVQSYSRTSTDRSSEKIVASTSIN
jgi:hypothetical protein